MLDAIKEFMEEAYPRVNTERVRVRRIGGILSCVYLLEIPENGKETVVVKKFRDIRGPLKWIPVSLWTIGARRFVITSEERMRRERFMSAFLRRRRFPVPKVFYADPKRRVLFEEYIKGEKATVILKRIIGRGRALDKERSVIRRIGQRIGIAHKMGVAIGDTKDANIIVTEDGDTYFIDLEQASPDGTYLPWDVAQFLYYAGHHVFQCSLRGLDDIVKSFLTGYIDGGGERGVIEEVMSVRLLRALSVCLLPHVLCYIVILCQDVSSTF